MYLIYNYALVNNLVSSHSSTPNYEEDTSEGALDTLKLFFTDEATDIKFDNHYVNEPVNSTTYSCCYKILREDYTSPYTCGFTI